jgi:hemolysin activation/secretion protein
LLIALYSPVFAQTLPSSEEFERRLRNQQQQEELQRQREESLIRIDRGSVSPPEVAPAAPSEEGARAPCASIDRFDLQVPSMFNGEVKRLGASLLPLDRFYFLRELLPTGPDCFDQARIAQLLAQMTGELLQRGYTTTRVAVPPQSTTGGEFVLWLLPGTVGRIEMQPSPMPRTSLQAATLRNVLSLREGDIFNVREVEQAIESLRRAQSQDMDFALRPGAELGVSDLIVTMKSGRPVRLVGSVNNHGSRATGRYQGSISATVDNLLGLSDVLSFSQGFDVGRDGGRFGTESRGLNYGLVWHDWQLQFSLNDSSHFQRVNGIYQTFISSGSSGGGDVKLSYELYRHYGGQVGATSRLSAFAKRGRRISQSFIDDAEIGVQFRDVAPVELGLNYRNQTVLGQIDLSWSRVSNLYDDNPYWYDQTSASYWLPFSWRGLRGSYSGSLFAQTTRYPLKGAQWLSVGGPYSVRGFSGEVPLVAEQGMYSRNEVELALGATLPRLYFGFDAGRVFGPNAKYLLGDFLVGKFLGLRGQLGSVQYDLQFAYPVSQPDGFPERSTVALFSFTYAY